MPIETKDLEPILDRVHEWTRNADSKVDILVAVQAGVVALLMPSLVNWIQDAETGARSKLLFLIGFGFLVAALLKSLQSLFPRTDAQWWTRLYNWWIGKKSPPTSITFFGHIAQYTLDQYREKLRTMTEDELREDWISQIHISAGIAGRKHHNIKVGILLFIIGLTIIGATYAVANRGWV